MTQASGDQIKILIEFMKGHTDLAKGLLRGPEGRVRSKQLWAHLTNHLNSMGGAVKTEKQWMRVWADKKYLTKKAVALSRRAAMGTGGGPPAPLVGDCEREVLSVMGQGFGEPQSNARVSPFPQVIQEEFLVTQNTVSTESSLPWEEISQEIVEIPLFLEESRTQETAALPNSQINSNPAPERSSTTQEMHEISERQHSQNRNFRSQLVQHEFNIYQEVKQIRISMERQEKIFSMMVDELRKVANYLMETE